MINVIQYLEQNPALVSLLKEQKVALIGFSATEQQAILDSFEEELCLQQTIWN
ncbi:competence protein ComX [Lysinibacillus sphaericus]|uniref:ComX pheromone n=3 Tax=Lysinibacillus TaxID=400634 RepID=A0A2S0JVV8_LYSSH|nr:MULTISPECIES: competence pheromone ComX [Lysinibacillus]AHN23548.1 competence protein ComX [Lysinibacillus varians]AVK95208.1 competence protein ComX [Lysinibacillus sphaericus]MCS1381693.1 competence pheromone ComX [Lysinibacillus sphaericus]MED4545155.1 competence pheromone ComX [Lysinibacillus sphaericus]TKI18619.1 competence protein ComX [Lysinibacillus sphaericus]